MTRSGDRPDPSVPPPAPVSGAGAVAPRLPAPLLWWLRRLLPAAGVLVLVGATVWWWSRPEPVELPLPSDATDPELCAALEGAQKRVRSDPRSADAWGHLAMLLQAHGYGVEAGRYFVEAQQLDPGDGRWPYFRALAAFGEDAEHALPLLRQAVAGRLPGEGQESAVRLRLAEALLEHQELAEARDLFQLEWQRRPGDPRAGFGLGLIARAWGQADAAEKYLTAARKSATVRKPATAQLAALARGRGDLSGAVRWEAEFVNLPDESPAWPDPFVLQLQRCRVGSKAALQAPFQLEAQRRYADAAAAYARQIEHQPTPQNYAGAGLNAVLSGQTDRGLDLLREAVRIDGQRPESHFALAKGLYQVASAERERAPDSRAARERFLEAAAAARRAAELKPNNARAFLLWGQALMNRGEWTAALDPLRKGVAVRPELFDMQLALGEALLEAGQLREAETHLNNARELDTKSERPAAALRRLQHKRE